MISDVYGVVVGEINFLRSLIKFHISASAQLLHRKNGLIDAKATLGEFKQSEKPATTPQRCRVLMSGNGRKRR
jgi:hypothetical protein